VPGGSVIEPGYYFIVARGSSVPRPLFMLAMGRSTTARPYGIVAMCFAVTV